jgi:hypothetical protein
VLELGLIENVRIPTTRTETWSRIYISARDPYATYSRLLFLLMESPWDLSLVTEDRVGRLLA